MVGVPAAMEAANRLGIWLIPGVEISATIESRRKDVVDELVHILGYYSCCGPTRWHELERVLVKIQKGRYQRAEVIIEKLRSLKKPITLEQVIALAGPGVAPGRVHIARALVQAGHVLSLREAFNKYLYDGGPADAVVDGLAAEDAVHLICDTGGIAVLAHPWSLKEPLSVVERLKGVGLLGMEVYRGDGKANGFGAMAERYALLKLGGSDFHGGGDAEDSKLGKVLLPFVAIQDFLRVAQPIWIASIKNLLRSFAKETFQVASEKVAGWKYFCGYSEVLEDTESIGSSCRKGHPTVLRFSLPLTKEERKALREEVTQLKLKLEVDRQVTTTTYTVSRQSLE